MNALQLHWPVLAVLVPLATAPLVSLLRHKSLSWAAATAASLCTFGIAALLTDAARGGAIRYAVGSWPAPYGIELRVDAFAALLLLIVTGASSAALLIARRGLTAELGADREHLFYTAWLLALAGLLGIIVSGDAFNIFVFMEISSLATYVLIAGGARRQALTAVFKYLIMGTIGATFYLVGVGLLYMMTGTLNLADIAARIGGVAELRPVLVAGGFITVGLALKAAVFPLHAWLPGAYTHAPHAATAFIAACSTKVALYVLFTFQFSVFQQNLAGRETQFATLVLALAVLAMIVASCLAIFERDLKRMLAYSSVAQVGYVLFGAGLASVSGLTAAIAHMFNHALAKGTLFLAIACLAGAGAAVSLDGIAGAARRAPVTMAVFLVAGLSLIGIPGTAGFVSKWYLVIAALELGPAGAWLAMSVLASSVLAVVYVWRVIDAAYLASPGRAAIGSEPGYGALAVLAVAAAANVYFGLQPSLPLALAQDAAATLLPMPFGK
jgi:multicomponent Na+:H+ antiporter subunit D